jgi:1-acyl-sn-glycerol-3-phosphate acyltransferase
VSEAAPPEFVLDTRRTVWYAVARIVFRAIVGSWFRPVVRGRDHVPQEGPAILAPVHRSFADFAFSAFLTRRKLFFMAKEELWKSRAFGRLLASLGVFPVRRDGADREAMRRAQEVLDRGQLLVLFPEGTRRSGTAVGELHEGAAFLAARTGAPIVPIGIGGSDVSMPKGRHVPRPLRIRVVAGAPLAPPPRSPGGRVPRSSIHATTEALRQAIQDVYDQARREFEGV